MHKPLLLIDVDGVISLFGFERERLGSLRPQLVDGITHFLSLEAGDHLNRLADTYELVWCTGWEEKANDYLPAALGLPGPLRYVSFDGRRPQSDGHWKLSGIERLAGPERALAWIDDAHDARCREWAASRAAPTLLISTEPAHGLTDEHVAELLVWARTLSARGGD